MKIFNTNELLERQSLINKLTFSIYESNPDSEEDDNLYIEFFDESGNRYDGDDITYYIQNEIPSEMFQDTEGLFSYYGSLSKLDIKNILLNIGFKED